MIGTRISSLLGKITVLVIICCCSLPAQAKYGGGTGEPNDPYLIFDANQMNAIGSDSNDWDKYFKLMADIDLSGFTGDAFNIIGYWSDDKPFTGVFDGNDHTISNFTYASTGRNHVGLFGSVYDPHAEIKNLGLIDSNIDAGTRYFVGSLVGSLYIGTITNCYVDGGSVKGKYHVGGLAGTSTEGTITDCYSTVSVKGKDWVGGLVGYNYWEGTITNCNVTGSVTGKNTLGGLVGRNRGTITNCYSTGSVSGNEAVGGLAGANWGWDIPSTITNCYSTGGVTGEWGVGGLVRENYEATISNCYSIGSVSGTTNVGGLVGDNQDSTVSNSFWDTQTSGQATSAGGTPKTTAEMHTESTFTLAGWDFITPIWKMNCKGMSYPKLNWWQPVLGDFLCPDGVDMRDFAVLAAQWRLPPADPSADIAPNGGDNIVDRFDLAAMADNWLRGF